MNALSLSEIAAIVGGELHDAPDPAARVTGPWVCDSREAGPGGMFAALVGERADGHDYAADVVAAGAVGVLAQVLERSGETVATARSLNTEVGLPLTVLRAGESTRWLVLEMGARHRGDISHLTGLVRPMVGLVLNVGSAHVGEFGSRDAIALAKGELVEALPGASDGGVAVLNADDDRVAGMAARTAAKVVLFGQAPHADVRATDMEVGADGQARFVLSAGGVSAPVALRRGGARRRGTRGRRPHESGGSP